MILPLAYSYAIYMSSGFILIQVKECLLRKSIS